MWGRLAQLLSSTGRKSSRELRDVGRVVSGDIDSTLVQPKGLEGLPVEYTSSVHNRLLQKHPDIANLEFINNLNHIRTIQNPTKITPRNERDIQYLFEGIGRDGALGRVSIKPMPDDLQSYINTAHVIGGDNRIKKMLLAGSADPASPIGGGTESMISALNNTSSIPKSQRIVNDRARRQSVEALKKLEMLDYESEAERRVLVDVLNRRR